MEPYIILGMIIFGVTMALFLPVYLLINRDRKSREKPELFVDVADELGWTFHEGEDSVWVWVEAEPARVTGSRDGRDVEIVYETYSVQRSVRGRRTRVLIEEIEVAVELSSFWRPITLLQRVEAKSQEVTGADVPIGDPGFDEEFILTGRVDDQIEERLLDREIQRGLRTLIGGGETAVSIASGRLVTRRRLDDEDVDAVIGLVEEQLEVAARLDEEIPEAAAMLDESVAAGPTG